MLAPTRVFDILSNTQSPSRVRPGRALWFQEAYSRSSVSIKCTGSMMRRPSALGAAVYQQGLQHFLVCQGRRDLPAQRHDADAVGNAPAQTAYHIIAVAALAGDVFLGYGAVAQGRPRQKGLFRAASIPESLGRPVLQAAGLSRRVRSKVEVLKVRRAEPAAAPCAVSTRRPAASASASASRQRSAFSNRSLVPGGGGD